MNNFSTFTFTFYVKTLLRTCEVLSCSYSRGKLHLWKKTECRMHTTSCWVPLSETTTLHFTNSTFLGRTADQNGSRILNKYYYTYYSTFYPLPVTFCCQHLVMQLMMKCSWLMMLTIRVTSVYHTVRHLSKCGNHVLFLCFSITYSEYGLKCLIWKIWIMLKIHTIWGTIISNWGSLSIIQSNYPCCCHCRLHLSPQQWRSL